MSWVYFIEALGAGEIKIGYSKNPRARLSHAQVMLSQKVSLLGVVPGAIGEESLLHERFASCRIRCSEMVKMLAGPSPCRAWAVLALIALRRTVDRRIGIQHTSRIGQGRAGIECNGDTKSLGYFFTGRPGLDGALGVNANAAVAARSDGDRDGDEFAGLGVEMCGLIGALIERDEAGDSVRRQ